MKRLGRTQSGIQGIKNHHWFAGFDWDGFDKQSLVAPIVPRVVREGDGSEFLHTS
jgi:hypothetical protein